MSAEISLLDFILNLLKNPQAQAEFRASPEQVLAVHGLTGVCAADIHETLPLVTDHRSVELTSTSHSAPPSVVRAPGDGDTHAAIDYLRFITNAYTYEDHGVHIDESVHVNIWAVGDVAQTFDASHVVPDGPGVVAGGHIPGPAMPGPGAPVSSGNWVGDGHGNAFGQGRNLAYSDHVPQGDGNAHGPAGNSPEGLAGSSPSNDLPCRSGHDQGDGHLHSFGSGATTSLASGTRSPAAYSGDTGGSHASTGSGTPTDSGNAASTTGPDDCGHSYDAHSSLGESYYSQGGEHGVYDVHDEPSLHLDLH
jgi:hypothetical protein